MKAKRKIEYFALKYLVLLVIGFIFGIFASQVLSNSSEKKIMEEIPFFKFREDIIVVCSEPVIEKLNKAYMPDGPEILFCLIGREEGNRIVIDDLAEQEYVYQGNDYILYQNDPPCQIENSIGSIHSHPRKRGCNPSPDDIFTFGEMRDPEPVINVIQCDYNEFYIYKMPGKQEPFNFNKLRWGIG